MFHIKDEQGESPICWEFPCFFIHIDSDVVEVWFVTASFVSNSDCSSSSFYMKEFSAVYFNIVWLQMASLWNESCYFYYSYTPSIVLFESVVAKDDI